MKEAGMTNGIVKLLRKGRDWLKTLVAAMEYSSFDYTNDRISGLEHELKQLKNELGKHACRPEPPTAGSTQVRQPAKPEQSVRQH
jgi:hypothetical protein